MRTQKAVNHCAKVPVERNLLERQSLSFKIGKDKSAGANRVVNLCLWVNGVESSGFSVLIDRVNHALGKWIGGIVY